MRHVVEKNCKNGGRRCDVLSADGGAAFRARPHLNEGGGEGFILMYILSLITSGTTHTDQILHRDDYKCNEIKKEKKRRKGKEGVLPF